MTLIRTKPEMRFQGLFDNLFSPEFQLLNRSGLAATSPSLPKVNISESEDSYQLELAVPGMAKEEFKIKLDQEVLSVSSEKKEEATKDNKAYRRQEFSYQAFERRFNLPEDVDSEKITANYVNGVLSITIPKKEEAKPQPPKAIEIA
jgi:HSP20 family protein